MKFSTLTSAMSFKSRKNSSNLLIQDRPSDIPPYTGEKLTLRQRTRPPATSVSTVISSDDANEPQTPTDFTRDTASPLLHASDLDLFPSPSIRKPSHFPDPNRLSVWSGSSASDMMSRKGDLGVSFKRLSSTDSQYLGVDLSANSSETSLPDTQLSPTQSMHGHRQKQSLLSPGIDFDRPGSHPSLSKSGSSSTLTERNKSNLEPTPTPYHPLPSRHRGMTEDSSWSTSSIPDKLRGKGSTSPTPPYRSGSLSRHHLIRQTSVGPPSAPPAQALPAPPVQGPIHHSPESSSSRLSFASAVSTHTHRELPTSGYDVDLQNEPGPSTVGGRHIVKRSISHQVLPKQRSQTSSPVQSGEISTGKHGPRKQRSFHGGSRSTPPLHDPPPVPIYSPSPQHDPHFVNCGWKGTVPSRKRLFSGGSYKRPPSSVLSTGEDDHASVFSGESESVSFINSFAADSPQPDDPPAPSSPSTASANFAQKIVSSEELLRIEASFNDMDPYQSGSPRRQRVRSFASVSTSMSEIASLENLQIPDSPRHYVVERASNRHGCYNNASESGSLRHFNSRINTNVSTLDIPSPTQASSSPLQGLPPPPRRRTMASGLNSRASTPTPTGLPPPPRRKPSNVSNRSHPRSIMKKPSFLDIEDNDSNQRRVVVPASRFVGSFLDLDKGKDSFDTIRSEEERENHR